jgi:multidrug efflux system membrane fusion protein|tara:strand:+ start:11802 stop:12878 length:1077 start_codon:yes stop_codon:yes gene_type:complete
MKKSHAIATGFAGIIVLWMGVGMLFGAADNSQAALSADQHEPAQKMRVETREQKAVPVISYVIAQGHVMPDRAVIMRAKAAAQVQEILIKEGHIVKAGDVLAKLDIEDRQIKLDKAKAKTAEAQRKYDSAKSLGKKGYTAETRIDETLTALKTAQADEKQIALEVENTNLTAPFDGIIDHQNIEQGNYVRIGDEAFTIVDNDPLVITVYVPQHEISEIKTGGKANVELATGQAKEGVIRFVAPRAEHVTRSFRVEIEIANPDSLPSGTSATARIPKQSIMAHFVSPSLLSLDEKGVTGIKTVDLDDAVVFHPVKIVKAMPDGIYVSGLPESARIIINGQGFVRAGETVSFVGASDDNH